MEQLLLARDRLVLRLHIDAHSHEGYIPAALIAHNYETTHEVRVYGDDHHNHCADGPD